MACGNNAANAASGLAPGAGCTAGAGTGAGIAGTETDGGGDLMFLTRGSAEFELAYGPPAVTTGAVAAREGAKADCEVG